MFNRKSEVITPDRALPGRTTRPAGLADKHRVLDAPLVTDVDARVTAIYGGTNEVMKTIIAKSIGL